MYNQMVRPLSLRSKVSTKGQTVIPKPIREALGIRPGDEVTFTVRDGEVVLKKQSDEDILEAFLTAIPKRKLPEDIDWDAEHYSQFEDEPPRGV